MADAFSIISSDVILGPLTLRVRIATAPLICRGTDADGTETALTRGHNKRGAPGNATI